MGMSTGSKGGVQSEINVTPLIDVCLVLLIIFMVVTPMLQKGTAVNLPQTADPDKHPDEGKTMVAIDDKKYLYIDTEKYFDDAKRFGAKLKEDKERNVALEVILKGDRSLTYGDVLGVMKICNEAGITGVALVTEKQHGLGGD
jgi:biopolymer transport protein TolR